MAFPFFVSVPEKFEPRRHLGRSDKLSEDQREMLDQLDILEQKADFGNITACRALNLSIIVGILAIFIGWPIIALVGQNWRDDRLGKREQTASIETPVEK